MAMTVMAVMATTATMVTVNWQLFSSFSDNTEDSYRNELMAGASTGLEYYTPQRLCYDHSEATLLPMLWLILPHPSVSRTLQSVTPFDATEI